jgi:DNA-binding beta-propeller fold protein YncE
MTTPFLSLALLHSRRWTQRLNHSRKVTFWAACIATIAACGGGENAVAPHVQTSESSQAVGFARPATPAGVRLAVDNAFSLYVNGQLAGNGNDWTKSLAFPMALNPGDVIAIQATDLGMVAGLIAEVTAGGITYGSDTSWKISTKAESGWNTKDFNDSAWIYATEHGAVNAYPWGVVSPVVGIDAATTPARWIWTENNSYPVNTTVYFRFKVPSNASVSQNLPFHQGVPVVAAAAAGLNSQAPELAYGPQSFTNFESPHVHPLERTPNGERLLAVNTEDASLMIFNLAGGTPRQVATLPVGLDPVTVRSRSNKEAWVLNRVSGSVSIVNLENLSVDATLSICHEPGDVVFVGQPQRAYISCTRPNKVLVVDANTRNVVSQTILAGEGPRSLALSPDGKTLYAAIFESGTPTTVLVGDTNDGRINNVTQNPAGPWRGVSPVPNNGASFNPPLNPLNPPPPPVSTIVRKSSDGFFVGSAPCNNQTFGDPIVGVVKSCWVEAPSSKARTLCAKEGQTCRFSGRQRVVYGEQGAFSSGGWFDDAGGDWTSIVTGNQSALSNRVQGWDLPDRDVAIIDTASGEVRYQTRLMNAVMSLSVNPVTGRVHAIGTDAINHIRFEPVLNGRFLRVNMASFTPGGEASIVDLNPHLNYQTASVGAADRAKSIGDPRAMVWARDGQRAFISGMGSNSVISLNAQGQRLASVDVAEGPTGLALAEDAGALYVLNRFAGKITQLDMATLATRGSVSYFDPTPTAIRQGRKFLYDTRFGSGTGHVACASCHIDARADRLAWDLGDPSGNMETRNGFSFHPMKGPMKTQTLQNIVGSPALHHRGDRADLPAFSGAFQSLQGKSQPLDAASAKLFEAYIATITFPPNPHRNPDNSFSTAVAVPGPAGTIEAFADARAGKRDFDMLCIACHVGSRGRSDVRGSNVLHLNQPNIAESPQGYFERMGLFWKSLEGSTAGTGTRPNGAHDSTQENEGEVGRVRTWRALFLSFEGPREDLLKERSANAHAGVGLQVSLKPTSAMEATGVLCASENQTCRFSGTREVMYGAGQTWRSAVLTGGVACNNQTFGDPLVGTVKECRLRGAPLRRCATEGEICSAPGLAEVFYGGTLSGPAAPFTRQLTRDNIACSNGSFDVVPQASAKACYVRPADDWATAQFLMTQAQVGKLGLVVRTSTPAGQRGGYFAGNGVFQFDRLQDRLTLNHLYMATSVGTAVTLTAVSKGSEYRLGVDANLDGRLDADQTLNGQNPRNSTPGAWGICATENQGRCNFVGNRVVRYGIDGQYSYGVFSNTVACSNSVFGDPKFGTVKTCEIAAP